MNKILLIAMIAILAVLAIGGFIWYSTDTAVKTPVQNQQQAPAPTPAESNAMVDIQVAPIVKTFEVTYTDAGFTPSTLAIQTGDTVVFKNQSSAGMWVASAMHPTHNSYNGTSLQQHCPDTTNTSFDECKAVSKGESWSFIFTKTGSWGYHNHSNPSKFGKIVVE